MGQLVLRNAAKGSGSRIQTAWRARSRPGLSGQLADSPMRLSNHFSQRVLRPAPPKVQADSECPRRVPHSAVAPVVQRHVSLPKLTSARLHKAVPRRSGLLTCPLLGQPTAALAHPLSSKSQALQFRGDASLRYHYEAGTLGARLSLQPTRAHNLAPVP